MSPPRLALPFALDEFLSCLDDAVFLVGPDDQVLFVNPRLAALVRNNAEQVVGRPYNYLFGQLAQQSPDAKQTLTRLLEIYDSAAQHPAGEFLFGRPDARSYRVMLYPVDTVERQRCIAGIARELSAGSVSITNHTKAYVSLMDETRFSLMFIKGCVSMLLSSLHVWNRQEQEDFLRAISKHCEQIVILMEDVRDLLRVETGELVLDCRPTDVRQMMDAVVHRLTGERAHARFDISIDEELADVCMDGLRLSRGLCGLLDAVLRLAFEPVAHICVRRCEDELRIDIGYEGVGIPSRLDAEMTHQTWETCVHDPDLVREIRLELFIANGIIRMHNGRLWAETADGGRYTLHIAVPFRQQTALPSAARMPAGTADRKSDGGKPRSLTKVMVIENDVRVLRLLRVHLELAGYRVVSTNEGERVLELAALEVPDLMLLNPHVPGLEGLSICRELRAFSTVPIIILTDDVHEEDAVRGLTLGADDYVVKPFRTKELLARIQAALRRSDAGEYAERTQDETPFRAGDLEINFARRRVTVRGQYCNLTPIEYKLLSYLAANAERVLTHEQLVTRIWGPMFRQETQYLWVNISRLRAKIEKDPSKPQYILTERGVGYYFQNPRPTP